MGIYSDTCFHLNRLSALKKTYRKEELHIHPPKNLPILPILQLVNRQTDRQTDGQMDRQMIGKENSK